MSDLIDAGVLLINDGYRMKNEELGATGIPFVRGGDIQAGIVQTNVVDHVRMEFMPQLQPKLLVPHDVAFITKGTVGRVGRVRPDTPPFVVAPQVCFWRSLAPTQIDPTFLYYLILSREFQDQLDAVKTHGSMAADYVSLTDQRGFRLTIPAADEQRAIGSVLGALDDKIELNGRMNETLEEMAQALFKSWFVDFSPFRRGTEGGFSDSVLGAIPSGWSVCSISDLAEIVGGSTPSTKVPRFWVGGTHCWATPKDLAALRTPVVAATERTISDEGLSQISSGLLPVGTVLLSSRAPIGYLGIAEVPLAINQGFIAMKPKQGVPSQFLLRWAESAHDEIVSRANGSTFLEISKSNFRPIRLVRPPSSVLSAYDQVAGLLYNRVVANERQTRTLAELRDLLLPKLLSGELRIRDAERAVEAVA